MQCKTIKIILSSHWFQTLAVDIVQLQTSQRRLQCNSSSSLITSLLIKIRNTKPDLVKQKWIHPLSTQLGFTALSLWKDSIIWRPYNRVKEQGLWHELHLPGPLYTSLPPERAWRKEHIVSTFVTDSYVLHTANQLFPPL